MLKIIIKLPKHLTMNNTKKVINHIRLFGLKGLYKKIVKKLNNNPIINESTCNDFFTYYKMNADYSEILKGKMIDIIIPVYNAYDDLKECYESVLKYTDLRTHRLILINDKSTDKKIYELLDKIKEETKTEENNIVVLENEENLGFVQTVNVGMSYSNNDVILLNSDTLVTKQWIEKLIIAAYSEDNIASVTPFSNNATICSLPEFLKDNKLPEGFTVDKFAETVERISLIQYPNIPTAVGFCMYITRKSIDEIGLLNYKEFGKGYGEENDYSMRAFKKGYKNILCDNLFIYHKGGQSFSSEIKRQREIESVKKMNAIHPEYTELVEKFVNDNPLKYYHDTMKEIINMREKFVR